VIVLITNATSGAFATFPAHKTPGLHVDMPKTTSVEVLVADSGPLLRGVPLETWSSQVVTVKGVVSEVRDERTRRRLQVLPYELQVKEPSQEALHFGVCLDCP